MMHTRTFQDMLISSISLNADRIAIVTPAGKRYSYRQVDEATDTLAQYFSQFGQTSIYLLQFYDKALYILFMIAMLKSRQIFFPIDVSFPSATFCDLTAQLSNPCLITDIGGRLNYPNQLIYPRFLDDVPSGERKAIAFSPSDPIYIYCTSGSSGTPKMILGQNVGLAQFVSWEIEKFGFNETTKVAAFTPPSFDPFLRDVFIPLCSGGTVFVPDRTIQKSKNVVRYIQDNEITLLHCIPSFLSRLFSECTEKNVLKCITHVLFAGERLPVALVKMAYSTISQQLIMANLYGPTETTLAKLCYDITLEDCSRKTIPIGKPIKGSNAYVVNSGLHSVPQGERGEICITTNHGTLGYLNHNSSNFLANHLDENVLLYRTGDIGVEDEDGNLEYIGRTDRQIKRNGTRIELDGIEAHILLFPAMVDAAVVYSSVRDEIVCFYSATSKISALSLRRHLLQRFLPVSVPAHFIQLDRILRNRNGKKDYVELIAQYEIGGESVFYGL